MDRRSVQISPNVAFQKENHYFEMKGGLNRFWDFLTFGAQSWKSFFAGEKAYYLENESEATTHLYTYVNLKCIVISDSKTIKISSFQKDLNGFQPMALLIFRLQ